MVESMEEKELPKPDGRMYNLLVNEITRQQGRGTAELLGDEVGYEKTRSGGDWKNANL